MAWRRKWQPTTVFLPEKSHGQWSLAGYSPWGRKESDMTERREEEDEDLKEPGVASRSGFLVLGARDVGDGG